jgi:hypothetical protein
MNSNNGNGMFALICIGGFFLLVGIVILLSALQSQKRKRDFAATIAQLGFQPLPQGDAVLLGLLQNLYAPARVNRVRNLAARREGDETYYLLDITYTSPRTSYNSSSSMTTENNNAVIISPHLDLPPFILMNRIKAPGALAGMADSVLIYAAGAAGFTEYKEVPTVFDMNYMLFVKEDPRVKTAFTDELLSQIGLLDGVVGRGYGQLLLLNRFDLRGSSKLDALKLTEQVNLLRQVTGWLVK